LVHIALYYHDTYIPDSAVYQTVWEPYTASAVSQQNLVSAA